jgi:hypothetical protein
MNQSPLTYHPFWICNSFGLEQKKSLLVIHKKIKNVLQKILYTPGYRVPRENCNSQSFQFYNCIIKQSQKKQRMAAIIFS